MISDALELRVEGEQVSQTWCMGAVSHCYGWLGGDKDGEGGLLAKDKANGAGRLSGDAGALLDCKVIH